MNELFQQWLDARLSVPGIIACGVATAKAIGTCRSTDDKFPAEQMGKILHLLQDIPPAPGLETAEPRWQTWVFVNGKIRTARRPDGWIFAAAVRANTDAAQILDPLTEEFFTLKLASDAPGSSAVTESKT